MRSRTSTGSLDDKHIMCSAHTGCEQHSLSEQSVMPSRKQRTVDYELNIVEETEEIDNLISFMFVSFPSPPFHRRNHPPNYKLRNRYQFCGGFCIHSFRSPLLLRLRCCQLTGSLSDLPLIKLIASAKRKLSGLAYGACCE